MEQRIRDAREGEAGETRKGTCVHCPRVLQVVFFFDVGGVTGVENETQKGGARMEHMAEEDAW